MIASELPSTDTRVAAPSILSQLAGAKPLTVSRNFSGRACASWQSHVSLKLFSFISFFYTFLFYPRPFLLFCCNCVLFSRNRGCDTLITHACIVNSVCYGCILCGCVERIHGNEPRVLHTGIERYLHVTLRRPSGRGGGREKERSLG